jgi:sulfite exporter TauE/SafE
MVFPIEMNPSQLSTLFMLGLLGTGHCIGMCGPLIVAFPARTGKVGAHLAYHSGRILTYVAVGATMGSVGAGIAHLAALSGGNQLAWIARIQVTFSLLAAAFLLGLGLSRLGLLREPSWLSLATPGRIPGYRRIIQAAQSGRRAGSMCLLGVLMGFLPCGLSFAAFARALPSGSPLTGAALLLAFGVGTLPGLLALGIGASGLLRRYQKHSDILAGLLMIYMAVSLGADGLQAIL